MQFVGATNSWTVQTLTTSDGIGHYQEGIVFNVARGHFGAAAGKYFADSGGTAPDMTGGISVYTIDRSGFINIDVVGDIDVAGVGAVIANVASPFQRTSGFVHGGGYWVGVGGSPGSTVSLGLAAGANVYSVIYNTMAAVISTTNILNSDLGVSAVVRFHGSFNAAT
jgi:hypothetical protein